jgi:hypothetical protein
MSIKKTIRLSSDEWNSIEKKLNRTGLNFSEFTRKSLLNKKIKEYKKPVDFGITNLQLIGITTIGIIITMLILINTILPIEYISVSSWIIPQNNRYIAPDNHKYLKFHKSELIPSENKTDFYFIKID